MRIRTHACRSPADRPNLLLLPSLDLELERDPVPLLLAARRTRKAASDLPEMDVALNGPGGEVSAVWRKRELGVERHLEGRMAVSLREGMREIGERVAVDPKRER